jgi:hypothetical protein
VNNLRMLYPNSQFSDLLCLFNRIDASKGHLFFIHVEEAVGHAVDQWWSP